MKIEVIFYIFFSVQLKVKYLNIWIAYNTKSISFLEMK